MSYNRAHSAPKGYDLRTPYNVPMGEIQLLHVVKPFSTRSIQQNTIVEGFQSDRCWNRGPHRCKRGVTDPDPPRLIQRTTLLEGFQANRYQNRGPPSPYTDQCNMEIRDPEPPRYIQVVRDPNSAQFCFNMVTGEVPWYQDIQMEKLYRKDAPRLK